MARIGYLALAAIALLGIVYSIAFVNSPFSFRFNDVWEHTAALNALLQDPWSPRNPHVASDETSPRFTPLHIAGALLGRIGNANAVTVYNWLTLVNFVTVFGGLLLFARRYFESRYAPVTVAAMLLLAWGTGVVWSNSTMLAALPIVAGYPSFFVLGLTFLTWWLGIGILRNTGAMPLSIRLAALTLLLALAVVSHLLTAVIAAGGLGAFALFEPKSRWINRLLVLATIPLAFAVAELWPYYTTLSFLNADAAYYYSGEDAHPNAGLARALSLLDGHPFYIWPRLGFALGIVLLAPAFAVYHLVKRQHIALVVSFAGLLTVYVANLFIAIPLGHRTLLFAVLFGQLLMAAAFIQFLERDGRGLLLKPVQLIRRRPLAGAIYGLLLISAAVNLANAAYKLRPLDPMASLAAEGARADWVGVYRRLTAPLATDSVVLTRALDGWPLPSFAGKTVALLHFNPFVSNMVPRQADTAEFFAPDTANAARQCILSRWGATHVLARRGDDAVFEFLRDRAIQVSVVEPLVLYALDRDAAPSGC